MALAGENVAFTAKTYATRAEWLRLRQDGIGGSDVAAIIGISPWSSPAEVYLDKLGSGLGADLSNPTLEFGQLMEPVIAKRFQEAHPNVTVRRVHAILSAKDRPWAQASLDFECRENGEWGILEIKTARAQATWSTGVPDYYLTQVQHYLAVTGRSFAYVSVFFRDTCQFADYYVKRDDAFIDVIEAAVDTFWNDNVVAEVPPAKVAGTTNEARALTKIIGLPTGPKFKRAANEDAVRLLIEQYRQTLADEKAVAAAKRELASKLMLEIGNAKGVIAGDLRATWVRSEKTTLDTKMVREKYPDIYAECSTTRLASGGLRVGEVGKM